MKLFNTATDKEIIPRTAKQVGIAKAKYPILVKTIMDFVKEKRKEE